MNFKIRIIATLLAVLTLFGGMSIAVGAAEDDAATALAKKYLQTNIYRTPEEKLASMELMLKNEKYELYVDSDSGEVALHQPGTNNTLFSNPYDVASSKGSSMFTTGSSNVGTKEQLLMSQVIVNYIDNGSPKSLYSFSDAAMRGQIDVSKIKSGVRVEYTIGREEYRKLVPRQIPKESFDQYISKPLLEAIEKGALDGVEEGKTAKDNFYYRKVLSFYTLYDPSDPSNSQSSIDMMTSTYPYLKESEGNSMYVFASNASAREVNEIEAYIKEYCADTYSFEQMDIDHETTSYEAEDEESPVFKLALEYNLDDTGLSVRVPCNGLQYNTAVYTLENISILPYMGAGNTKNDGYNFYPDGSGSLFDFNLNKNETVRGKIYGTDYAYHQISGKYQKSIRVPVYGTVAEEVIYSYAYTKVLDDGTLETYSDRVSNTVMSLDEINELLSEDGVTVTKDPNKAENQERYNRGYVAVIESGESLADLETYYAGALSDYATMSNYFNPKPKDSYDIADSISVTSSSVWTVVSNRKYTGNIQIHYQMLGDDTYEASWLGMAEAYRDYLVKKGTIQRLTEEDVEDNIPLYMEVFGSLETQQTIATLPVNVMTPLTTFEDIYKMYSALSTAGVKNINFKLTGFANGGMYSTVPSALKWEKAVGGKEGFENLISQANEINAKEGEHIGIYPDFDFAYASQNSAFDSLNLKKDGIKTIDNRYTSKRQYSATQQKYVSYFQLAISPSRYSKFYEKLMDVYSKYGISTMSVASLGTALNSDFDEDDPYNREDSKGFTVQAFEDLSKNYSLMSEGGNAYTWGYVDHLLDLDLDSSRYVKSCASVPFLGAVLHGYVQFAGAPLNEEGDTDYAILKAIENGAGMYFILSKQNTQELKEDEILSQYYSIRYDIWEEDVIAYYNKLNSVLNDVQTSLIIDHKFLNYNNRGDDGELFLTERVLDADELDKDILEELKEAEKLAHEQERTEAINKVASVAEARVALHRGVARLEDILSQLDSLNASLQKEMGDSFGNLPAAIVLYPAKENLSSYRTSMEKIWYTYGYLEYQFILADEEIAYLEECLEFVRTETEGTSAEYQYALAQAQLQAAEEYLKAKKAEQSAMYNTLIDGWKTVIKNNPTSAAEREAWEEALDAVFTVDGFEAAFDALNGFVCAKIEAYNATVADADKVIHDFDQIKADSAFEIPEKEEEQEEVSGEVEATRYHVTNNNVVAVTYGDIVDGQKIAQKTFILNYNNYAVCVTYNKIVYTVEAGGYVIVSMTEAQA